MNDAKQKFSVIIPARNAEVTITACLNAIEASSQVPAEVILVNDGSNDQTKEIATTFSCKLVNVNIGKGPMQARFAGAKVAEEEILIFVDADVCVAQDSFEKMMSHFKDASIHAVTGLLSSETLDKSFSSIYKNEYMNYIFKRQPRDSAFVYGSIWAVRQKDMIYFDPISEPFGSLVSDSEIGFQLKAQKKTIVLDHGLQVTHLKEYTLWTLLKNDFKIPFLFSLMFLKYTQMFSLKRFRRFSHASIGQMLSTLFAFSALAFCFSALIQGRLQLVGLALMILIGVWMYWSDFLAKVFKRRGFVWCIKAFLFLPIDSAMMFCGMTAGFVWGTYGRLFKKSLVTKSLVTSE